MRKKLFKPLTLALATAMLFSVSCQDALETNYVPESDNAKTGTIKRSAEDAIEWALSFKNGQPGNQSRSNATANLADVKVITSATSRSNADTLIYAVNYADNAGYALISASCQTEPVLGYVESGTFDEEKAAENPSYSYFLSEAKRYAAAPQRMGDLYPPKPIDKITYVNDSIPPRLKVAWSEYYPEGYYFKDQKCGCVQTATAQVMSYLEQPKSITLTYPNKDKNVENINWNKLKQHKKSSFYCYDCPLTNEEHLVLARLCRQIGYLNQSYKVENGIRVDGGAAVDRNNVFNSIESLLPNNIIRKYLANIDGIELYEYLNAREHIAMLGGYYKDKNSDEYKGHAWVCDGGRRIGYYNTFTLIGGQKEYFSGEVFLHYNWGCGGMDNGYFLSTIFNPSKGKEYDNPGDGYNEETYDLLRWHIILKK